MTKAKADTNKRPTIRTVAKEAGVSVSTVSRVMNGSAKVDEDKKQLVQKAIERLNYQPDAAARKLSHKKNASVGLNISGNGSLKPYDIIFREHFYSELQSHRLQLEHIPNDENGLPSESADVIVLMELQRNDPRIAYLHKKKTPFVVVGHAEGERWAAPNDYDGGRQAAQHLLDLGHREMLFVANSPSHQEFSPSSMRNDFSKQRFRGFANTLAKYDIGLKSDCILNGGNDSLSAFLAVRNAIKSGIVFTAVFATSDELALGAVAALNDVGMNVPSDVSVIGFDDLFNKADQLTTVHQDIQQIAVATVKLVEEALADDPIRHIEIPVQLVERASCGQKK
jgi:LacI family transcriptional regulator